MKVARRSRLPRVTPRRRREEEDEEEEARTYPVG
jgi:hypothetical protein